MPVLISIDVPDYACPSFCTASQYCFGEEDMLRQYCFVHDEKQIEYIRRENSRFKTEEEIAEAKAKGRWRKEVSNMEETLEKALQGEQVTWSNMGCSKLIPDLHPEVHARAQVIEDGFECLRYNVWDWTYYFTAGKNICDVAWISFIPDSHVCSDLPFDAEPESASYKNAMANARLSTDPMPDPLYVRAIRVRMENSDVCYSHDEMFVVEGREKWADCTAFETRLFMVDKRFDSRRDMIQDIEDFDGKDINYSVVYSAMLGDG